MAACVVQAAVVPLALAVPAQAASDAPASTAQIGLAWDGPTTNLDWTGAAYVTTKGSFVGTPIAVPGDAAQRTAVVRNTGPGDAQATVEIRNVTTTNAAGTVNTDLENLVHLTWLINGRPGEAEWVAARAGDPVVTETFPIAQGASFPVTVGYYFPVDQTGGKNAGHASSVLRFDVRVTLTGDVPNVAGGTNGSDDKDPPDVGTGGSVVTGPAMLGIWAVLAGLLVVCVTAYKGTRQS